MSLPKGKGYKDMTRYERELTALLRGEADGINILKERKAELDKLEAKGRREKNAFRRECLAQEYARLKMEYINLESVL